MALYLMRHGEYVSKEIKPDCPLSDRGIVDVMRMAAQAAEQKETEILKIFHSGKKRALQTAIMCKEYLKPLFGIADFLVLNPNDDILFAVNIIEQTDNLMFVGHLPHLERLVSHLVKGDQNEPVIQFPTAGMVCLEKDDGTERWHIKWQLMP